MKERVEELEQLVSTLRHDINGALTPALMVADRLRMDADPRIQRAGESIARSIMRVVDVLKTTREAVPPRQHAPPRDRSAG